MIQSPELDSPEKQVLASMSALLAKAGLGYQGKFVEFDGRRVHYLEYGEGPAVLLLHGAGAGSAIWFRQIEILSKNRRVIVPDHPVFGLSHQRAYESPINDSLVRYVTGFMDATGLHTVDVIALSMGAQAALAVAIEFPKRFGKIVLIDSAGLGKAFPLIFKLATLPVFGSLIVRPNRWGQDSYFKNWEVVNSEFEDAELYRQYAYDVTLTVRHAHAMRASLRVITDLSGQKSVFTDYELRSIVNPTLVIWGAHDKVFPLEHGHRLVQHAPNSSLYVVENSAHVPLLDNPDEVNDLACGFLSAN